MKLDIETDLRYRNSDEASDRKKAIKAAESILGDKAEAAWQAWNGQNDDCDVDCELIDLWLDACEAAEKAYFESWAMRPQAGGIFLVMA